MKPLEIIKNLYLGNSQTPKKLELLKKYNIIAIINISAGKILYPSEIEYLKINMTDSSESNISPHLDLVVEFIHKYISKGCVLVHCQGGISRSPAFIVAYLTKYHEMTVDTAVKYMKSKKKSITPKENFIDAIRIWKQGTKN